MASEKKKTPGKAASKTTSKTAASKTTSKTAASKTASKAGGKATAGSSGKGGKSSAPKMDEQAFVKKMEQALLEMKAEINANLIANSNDFKEIVEGMDPKDLADIASDDIDRKIIEALGSQELKRLKLIDSALGRIMQGKYGYCIKCGTQIPQERLEALPYALMCIDCKTEEERRNR